MRVLPLCSVLLLAPACAEETKSPLDATLPGVDGKADGAALADGAPLVPGAAVEGHLDPSSPRRAHTLTLAGPARITLEVLAEGTTQGLDTTLHVLGPVGPDGASPALARASDDDGGAGRLSRLAGLALDAGVWQVVVGTYGEAGVGTYRLALTCDGEGCAAPAPTACAEETREAITACVDSAEEGLEVGGPGGPVHDTRSMDAFDLHLACAGPDQRACAVSVWGATADSACVFGSRYPDLEGLSDAVVVVGRSVVDDAADLDAIGAAQLVEAVKSTAYDDVTTPEAALEVIDEGRANRTELWDASSGGVAVGPDGTRSGAYTVWEVGAGDNSFGAVFAFGTSRVVATIVDGDFASCDVLRGPARRWCTGPEDCGDGLACLGVVEGLGLCASVAEASPEGAGVQCAPWMEDFGCASGSGLVCGSAAPDRAGVCVEAHHRFVAGPVVDALLPPGQQTDVPLVVRGIGATVAGVRLHAILSHPRLGDVKVSLVAPDGRAATVFDGASAETLPPWGELRVEGFGAAVFKDAQALGAWRLRVEDGGDGDGGTVLEATLEVTGRP
jgi:hypothetical protein